MSGLEAGAAIVGVVAFGLVVAEKLTDFCDSVRDAPDDVEAITLEVFTLVNFLSILRRQVVRGKPVLSPQGTQNASSISRRLTSSFKAIEKLLPEANSHGDMTPGQRVKWHFKKKKCSMLLTRLMACRMDIMLLSQEINTLLLVGDSRQDGDELVRQDERLRDIQNSFLLNRRARTIGRLKDLEREADDEERRMKDEQPDRPPRGFVSVRELVDDNEPELEVFQKLHDKGSVQGPGPWVDRETANRLMRTWTLTPTQLSRQNDSTARQSPDRRNGTTLANPTSSRRQDRPDSQPRRSTARHPQPIAETWHSEDELGATSPHSGRTAGTSQPRFPSQPRQSSRQRFPRGSPREYARPSRTRLYHAAYLEATDEPHSRTQLFNTPVVEDSRQQYQNLEAGYANDGTTIFRAVRVQLGPRILLATTRTTISYCDRHEIRLLQTTTKTETKAIFENGMSSDARDDRLRTHYDEHLLAVIKSLPPGHPSCF